MPTRWDKHRIDVFLWDTLVLCDVSWFLRGAADCCRDLWRCCGRRVFDAWADSNGPLSSWSFYGFPCSFGIFFVFFWGDGAMLLFNLWEAQLGGNPITDHLWKLPRKEAKVTLNSNGEISFEVSGGGLNKKNPLPWKSQNYLQVKCPSKVMDGNGRSHDVPFLFEKVFWPIFRGEFAVSLFGGLGWQKSLLKRARKRGIDLGLIPFFGMGFKKA